MPAIFHFNARGPSTRKIPAGVVGLLVTILLLPLPAGAGARTRTCDFDGDDKADLALYRPIDQKWHELGSGGGETAFVYGAAGDTPVPADYDGDGQVDPAIYRASTGLWAYRASSTGADKLVTYGGITPSRANGKIVFVGNFTGAVHGQTYTINADGSGATSIAGSSINPTFRPDGRRILYTTITSGSTRMFVSDSDGSQGDELSFSGTGTGILTDDSILYGASFPNPEVYIERANGGGGSNLTNNPASDGGGRASVDGSRVAFSSDRAGNADVWTMNIDGTNPVNVSNPLDVTPGIDTDPAWSPDGTKIVFQRDNDIWTMNANGLGQTNLTNSAATDTQPGFSPDGTRIVFSSNQAPSTGPDIWTMPATGGAATRVTTNGSSRDPDWGAMLLADIPVPADYDGDGKSDIAIYRASSGTWWVHKSSTNTDQATTFGGIAGDVPIPADYDGDGKADIGIYRNSAWYYLPSFGGDYVGTSYGSPGDVPVVGDYDGDDKADLAVFRQHAGLWAVRNSSGGNTSLTFGIGTDLPVSADYDGDGKTDVAVYRPEDGVWFIRESASGTVVSTAWNPPGTSFPSIPLAIPAAISAVYFEWNRIG